MVNSCDKTCRVPDCPTPFDRVVVSYLIKGGSLVHWQLVPTFTDPGPLTFQLQVGTTANNNADDWENVGDEVVDQFFVFDHEKRLYGKTNWNYYRVWLRTSRGEYVSDPTGLWGTLSPNDWRIAREIVRKELVAHKGASQKGYLLKRRVTGDPCPKCIDHMTREVKNPNCPQCYGTGFYLGYYYPLGCVWANLSPRSRHLAVSAEHRGTVDDIVVSARMTLVDLLTEHDIWINEVTDDRYFIHRVQHVAEWRGVPLIGQVELRLAPYSSIIYDIPIPDQILRLVS